MIKLFASDMDGTWLNSHQTYDHALFLKEFKLMQARNIKFVVASGNQFENLLSRFPETANQLYIIAENGALVARGRQILHTSGIDDQDRQIFLQLVEQLGYPTVVEGLQQAYIQRKDGPRFVQEMHKYFAKIKVVRDFRGINDLVMKFNLTVPEEKTIALVRALRSKYPAQGFVAGSSDSVDMQTKGMNKAVGLQYLGKKLGISPREMVTFGDSGNDVGMLRYAGLSFATATAMKEAKQAASQVIGSCDNSAVQKKIWHLLHN